MMIIIIITIMVMIIIIIIIIVSIEFLNEENNQRGDNHHQFRIETFTIILMTIHSRIKLQRSIT